MLDSAQELEGLEIDLLLEGIFQRFGHDFRGYRREPLRRKLLGFMRADGLATVSAVQDRMLHDAATGIRLLRALSLRPAALYGDPGHFRVLRAALGTWLRSRPTPRIWIAECVAPEDVFGLVILLLEEGLHDKTQIFATGANETLLQEAAKGRLSASRLADYERNYVASGGRRTLREYLRDSGGEPAFEPRLATNITWAQYNLATDASFNEFELIVCRDTLAEFGPGLKRRTLQLFHESLPRFGLLSVNGIEHPESDPFIAGYAAMERETGLYRRIV